MLKPSHASCRRLSLQLKSNTPDRVAAPFPRKDPPEQVDCDRGSRIDAIISFAVGTHPEQL